MKAAATDMRVAMMVAMATVMMSVSHFLLCIVVEREISPALPKGASLTLADSTLKRVQSIGTSIYSVPTTSNDANIGHERV